MSKYLYDDEDNVPMNEDAMPGIEMSWKLYSDMIAEMKDAGIITEVKPKDDSSSHYPVFRYLPETPLPFTDPPLSEKGCWNCMEYDGNRCMKDWNNADESYYFPERDDKEPTDSCDDWSLNPDVSADEFS